MHLKNTTLPRIFLVEIRETVEDFSVLTLPRGEGLIEKMLSHFLAYNLAKRGAINPATFLV
jgi:hypothetical protein